MLKNKKWENSKDSITCASMTVEAVFIMPIVVMVIFSLCYLAFYLHDYNRIQCVINQGVARQALNMKHETDSKKERMQLEVFLQEELKKNLFLLQIQTIYVEVNHSSVKAQVVSDIPISFLTIKKAFFSEHVKNEGKSIRYYPADLVRKYTVLKELSEGVHEGMQQGE